jgi:phosphatidylglycerol:prolipoprotein diacylglycerol transferase
MQQHLYTIPVKLGFTVFGHAIQIDGIPIFGYGAMLFIAFIVCITLLGRLGKRQGFDKDRLYDLALWVFVCGIIGARAVYMIQYKVPIANFYKFWEGGIVLYGSAIGGWAGYGLGWLWLRYRQHIRISTWRLADIVAPVVCIGVAIGRIGCLLNGCCYGHVCPDCGVTFPMMTAPARELVVMKEGYQTTAGFALDEPNFLAGYSAPAKVGPVEPGSAAAKAGLQPGDVIQSVNGQPTVDVSQLQKYLYVDWPRGEKSMSLVVGRDGASVTLPLFTPRTLPLHPTQLYETISMLLLFFLLMAFFPFRRHYGQVFVLLMICYAFHRFFNETLRSDTDPVLANLTLSQVGSIAVLLAGIGLELYLRRYSTRVGAAAAPAPPAKGYAQATA